MSLSVLFLGTSASRPTVERNVSSIAVMREGETLMFDCGEGTQRQMMRYHTSFNLGDIFFTHLHADHFLGVIGLLRTMSLQDRTDPIRLWAPRGSGRLLRQAVGLGAGAERLGFAVAIEELEAGQAVKRRGYAILPFPALHHATPAFSYALVEDDRLGRFNPDLAREIGIPEGPLWGQLHRGRAVALEDGRLIEPSMLVGPPRPGRRVVITGDTRPSPATVEAAQHADLLIHEATFADEDAARAADTGHATAREAAEVAARAGVRRLVLTHLSARYSRDASDLEREAKAVFANVAVAKDGMEVEVPFVEAGTEAARAGTEGVRD